MTSLCWSRLRNDRPSVDAERIWNKIQPMNTAADIRDASRADLVSYLESWGFQCYERETDAELRAAAQQNFETEGPGYGPMKVSQS